MQPTLQDRAILIVEDEPMIAMDVAQAFERAGATTSVTSTVHRALILVEDEKLSAAVLDHKLPDGESSPVCKRLEERGLPFVVYIGTGMGRALRSRSASDETAEALRARLDGGKAS
jgi:DNA-binding response OmpR family regulator